MCITKVNGKKRLWLHLRCYHGICLVTDKNHENSHHVIQLSDLDLNSGSEYEAGVIGAHCDFRLISYCNIMGDILSIVHKNM
jgi:hypothetical protein